MKLTPSPVQEKPELNAQQKISFATGIVGFPEFTQAEIVYQADQLPFMWLKGTGQNGLSFIVVEPQGLVPDYEIEITDSDIQALNLKSVSEAMILNIATLQKGPPQGVTLNLIGPIIINRRTLQARQVIIGNSQKYSARHPLFQTKEG